MDSAFSLTLALAALQHTVRFCGKAEIVRTIKAAFQEKGIQMSTRNQEKYFIAGEEQGKHYSFVDALAAYGEKYPDVVITIYTRLVRKGPLA